MDDPSTLWIDVPMEDLSNLPIVEVEVGGVRRRFLFDTGSPSMMSRSLVEELELEIVDRRKSQDGQGAVIDTDIVQADISLGGTTFRKIPVFVADFPETVQCLFDGVLGSEVLPLCAWQMDSRDSALRCSSQLSRLKGIDAARRQPLHSFGYPHAPFLDIRLSEKATSKALFDTGSQDYLTLSPADLKGTRTSGGLSRLIEGAGSLGGSIGGDAAPGSQELAVLRSLSIGDVELGEVVSPVRGSNPSLIGASILEHFVVTLDTRSSTAYFEEYRGGPFSRASFGFSMSFENESIISLVWNGSPAHRAGLRSGQRVTSINGEPVSASCGDIRRARRALADDYAIDIAWDSGAATLTRESRSVGPSQ